MNQFERTLHIVFGRLMNFENDPGFGYRVYKLPNEDQARIYRIARKKATKLHENSPPPQKGTFVAVAVDPQTQKTVMAYCSYPIEGGESIKHAALAYDLREVTKGSQHIADFLSQGKIPFADGEYAAAA